MPKENDTKTNEGNVSVAQGLAKGYTKISNSILESIMKRDFSKRELLILLYVFRNGYGFNREQSTCDYSTLNIFRSTGLDRSHIRTTVKALSSRNVLIIEGTKLMFNRHSESWAKTKTAQNSTRPKQPEKEAKTARERGQNSHADPSIELIVSDLQAPKEILNKKETPIPPKNEGSHLLNSFEAADQIIAFLNETTGKTFRHTIKGTQRLIKARLSEGFTIEDFKKVIAVKAKQWNGNTKMEPYLRPQTLFAKNFEAYLQESNHAKMSISAFGLKDSNTGMRGFGL